MTETKKMTREEFEKHLVKTGVMQALVEMYKGCLRYYLPIYKKDYSELEEWEIKNLNKIISFYGRQYENIERIFIQFGCDLNAEFSIKYTNKYWEVYNTLNNYLDIETKEKYAKALEIQARNQA